MRSAPADQDTYAPDACPDGMRSAGAAALFSFSFRFWGPPKLEHFP
jgi:hypothetical protein